jgi:hypothetical protein
VPPLLLVVSLLSLLSAVCWRSLSVSRCTVERLMRDLEISSAVWGKTRRATVADPGAERAWTWWDESSRRLRRSDQRPSPFADARVVRGAWGASTTKGRGSALT